ncbi:MAG: formate dehydrogenase accessory sulfurtransferase FdhD [Methylococcales bacterium]|nr:formate dehydrogenase accessory sulfurtransferase FdhD [Methylococcales bacterium]
MPGGTFGVERAGYRAGAVHRWQSGTLAANEDFVAEEAPVVLVYNGQPHVVMMATPLDLEDFALGFSLTEGIIQSPEEASSIRVYRRAKGVEVRVQIPEHRFSCVADKGRNLTGRTGCGLCGASTLEQAVRTPPAVGLGTTTQAEALVEALTAMHAQQRINQVTGAVHAAGWLPANAATVSAVREDVGRHNALDKLIGCLARQQTDFNHGSLLITSRASYEMVVKAAQMGISLLAAISAPTALAIELADQCGQTLVGFARLNRLVVYTHPERLFSTPF